MSTREDLIETTRELLWERGYNATSPRAILTASGVGQGSMYHHFHGKEALAQAAIERNKMEMRDQVIAELTTGQTAIERLRTYLLRERQVLKGCRFGRLAQDPDVLQSPTLQAEIKEMFEWIQQQLTGVIAAGIAAGEFHAHIDAAKTGAAIAATLQGAYVLARAEQDVTVFEDAIEGILSLLAVAQA